MGKLGLQGFMGGKMPGGMDFEPLRQQAMTQFNTQTVPSLAERFTSLGGGQRSSAFQGALGQAGAGLQENLAGMQTLLADGLQKMKDGIISLPELIRTVL